MARAPFQVLVLPYRTLSHGIEVAVFRRADYDLWQFVSGGGEDDESPKAAALREAREEAGIAPSSVMPLDATTMIPGCWFKAWASWPDDVLLIPEHAFAFDVGGHDVQLSGEHLEYAWCSVADAMERLRFDSNKNALWELNERLHPAPRGKRPAYR
ncbi:MAG: NUDIX pyrophosphatase [Myxococcota bacterium]